MGEGSGVSARYCTGLALVAAGPRSAWDILSTCPVAGSGHGQALDHWSFHPPAGRVRGDAALGAGGLRGRRAPLPGLAAASAVRGRGPGAEPAPGWNRVRADAGAGRTAQ